MKEELSDKIISLRNRCDKVRQAKMRYESIVRELSNAIPDSNLMLVYLEVTGKFIENELSLLNNQLSIIELTCDHSYSDQNAGPYSYQTCSKCLKKTFV